MWTSLHSHVGGSRGDINDMVYQLNSELRVSPAVIPNNSALERPLAAGVTTILFTPGSGTNTGGTGVLGKLGVDGAEGAEAAGGGVERPPLMAWTCAFSAAIDLTIYRKTSFLMSNRSGTKPLPNGPRFLHHRDIQNTALAMPLTSGTVLIQPRISRNPSKTHAHFAGFRTTPPFITSRCHSQSSIPRA